MQDLPNRTTLVKGKVKILRRSIMVHGMAVFLAGL